MAKNYRSILDAACNRPVIHTLSASPIAQFMISKDRGIAAMFVRTHSVRCLHATTVGDATGRPSVNSIQLEYLDIYVDNTLFAGWFALCPFHKYQLNVHSNHLSPLPAPTNTTYLLVPQHLRLQSRYLATLAEIGTVTTYEVGN